MTFEVFRSLWKSRQPPPADVPDCKVCKACPVAKPGTVKPHFAHCLVRLPRPADAPPNQPAHVWWPESVDDHPAIQTVNGAISAAKDRLPGAVKVTAFDYYQPSVDSSSSQSEESFDVLLVPAGIILKDVPLESLGAAVVGVLGGEDPSDASIQIKQLQGLAFLVCCHARRDARCGYLGPLLAEKLSGPLGQQCFVSSHIGGHQYAGNVIVYGKGHPADGTWFGGISAENAKTLVEALAGLQPGRDDPAADARLSGWWRGRIGMSKEEQAEHHAKCKESLGDIEDAA